jgi:hypothetical protein
VSSFVDIFGFEPPGDVASDEQEEYERPAWVGPPEGELGVTVPVATVVGRSDNGVVALRHAIAYSTGVSFDVVAVARGVRERDTNKFFNEQHFADPEELSDRVLRIGFELPDGVRVSNLGNPLHLWRPDREPTGSVLIPHGGGGLMGGRGRVEMNPSYWLWPRPSEGTWRVFVEWPAASLAVAATDIDGSAIVRAAVDSQPLWFDNDCNTG